MEKVNWGIIGLGNVANKFADSFKFSLNAKLLGISSNSQDKLIKFSERFKIKVNKISFKRNLINFPKENFKAFKYPSFFL